MRIHIAKLAAALALAAASPAVTSAQTRNPGHSGRSR
jgi:hypothetical protein